MMLSRSYLPNNASSSRCLSSIALGVLKVGDALKQRRVFSSEDVLEYSKASHHSNPLHFDPESARIAGFKDRVVYGMLAASLFPRIISSHFAGAIYVSQSLRFRLPVYVGDEIIGEVEAVSIKESKQKYLTKFSTKCFRDGEALAIIPTLAVDQVNAGTSLSLSLYHIHKVVVY